jgi:hypothetical protein
MIKAFQFLLFLRMATCVELKQVQSSQKNCCGYAQCAHCGHPANLVSLIAKCNRPSRGEICSLFDETRASLAPSVHLVLRSFPIRRGPRGCVSHQSSAFSAYDGSTSTFFRTPQRKKLKPKLSRSYEPRDLKISCPNALGPMLQLQLVHLSGGQDVSLYIITSL